MHTEQPKLEWSDRPRRAVVRLAGPITVSMVSHAVIALVDTLVVSRLGAAALAGVGLASVTFFTMAGFGFGFFRGSKTLISQAHGAGDEASIRLHGGAGLLSALVVGAVLSVLLFAVSFAMPFLTSSTTAGIEAQRYAQIMAIAGFPAMFYVAFREARYGVGDSQSPMRAALLANAVNIGLDYVLVVEFDYGVSGAGIASFCAFGVQALALIPARDSIRMPGRAQLHALVKLGVPTGVHFVLEIGSFMLLAILVSSMHEREMAAHQVALQLMHFVFLPVNALGEACAVLVGQAVGAGRRDLVAKVARVGRQIVLGYSVLWFAGLCFGRHAFAASFTDDPALSRIIVALLLAGAFFQLADGLGMLASAMLRGLGDVRYAAYVGVLASWLLTPPLTYLLGIYFGLGALGGWIGLCFQMVAQAVLLWWRLRRFIEAPPQALGLRPAAAG